jgi:tetratricopeptide (TPR) repeat protein
MESRNSRDNRFKGRQAKGTSLLTFLFAFYARKIVTSNLEINMPVKEEAFSWYEVPEDIKNLLVLAANNWENTATSEDYINQAVAKAESNTDVLVAAYRYFFYKNNNPMALQIAQKVIDRIKVSENFPDDWEQLKPILVQGKDDAQIRLYLNAYAASGLVLARLGELEKAKEITQRVKEINDTSEFAASVVHDILTRPPEEDEG